MATFFLSNQKVATFFLSNQKVIHNNPFYTSPTNQRMPSIANYMNVEGRLYINTTQFGVIPVKDYLAFLQINDLDKQKVSFDMFDHSEVSADYTQLGNDTPTVSKEYIVRAIVAYVNKYYTNRKFYIPIGSKYYEHHRYILENLVEKYPNMTWDVMSKNATQFMFRGVVSE